MKFYAMCKNRTPITLEAASLEAAKEKFKQWEPMESVRPVLRSRANLREIT